jgi:ParB family chromosome partitioning protein
MKENSNIIYGRLAEATHISGYSLERAMLEFEWLLEDNRWKEVGTGYENINDFLKTLNFSEFKIAIEQRKKIAQKLKELEASQRATADTLGVGVGTINRDIDEDVPNGTLKKNIYTNNKEVTDENVPNGTSLEDLLFTKSKPHDSNNSGENEWYTPIKYIESARLVMGTIDLDPATSVIANEIVKAKTFYTKEDDGLTKSWFGNVWLNPPYAQPWYQQMMLRCDAICFIKGRVKFIDLSGDATGAPLQGQTIMYFGKKANEFDIEFSKYGICK